MAAVYKRELKGYFHTMIGYVIIAFLIAFSGIYFMAYNLSYGYPYFSYVLSGVIFTFLIVVPMITMRSFAEEKKNRTDQLLLTSPVSLFKIVMGKYLAMVTILAIPCAVYLIFPLIIKAQGTAYILVDYLSILVFFLLGCVYIAIGMFISSLTESPIIAAVGTFGILMVLHLWSGIVGFLPASAMVNVFGLALLLSLLVLGVWKMTQNWLICTVLEVAVLVINVIVYAVKSELYESLLANLCGKLNLTDTFNSIAVNNLLDISGIILYLTIIGFFVFLTMEMIQKRRWS
ncbi:MAG: ABC transporter permease [Eubacteriales bacterium]|nr:ABC transporter permease [Eubacteriales bacterium]